MKLANQDKVQALDSEFGRMATEVGARLVAAAAHAGEDVRVPRRGPVHRESRLPAADPRADGRGQRSDRAGMCGGDSPPGALCRISHGGGCAATAAAGPLGEADGAEPGDRHEVPREVADALAGLDEHFAEFFTNRFNQRWNSGDLSPRERALPAWPPTSSIRPWTNPSAARGSRDRRRRPRTDQRGASAGGRVRDREGVAGLPGPSNSPAFRCSCPSSRSSSLSPE